MNSKTGDILSGVISVLFGGFIIVNANTLPREAAVFPQLIGGMFILIGIILTLKSTKLEPDSSSLFKDIVFPRIILTFISWFVCILLLERLGFYASIFLFMAVLCIYMTGSPPSTRKVLTGMLFSGLTTMLYWVVFTKIVELELPGGMLM